MDVRNVSVQLELLSVDVRDNHPKNIECDDTEIQQQEAREEIVREKSWQECGSEIEGNEKEEIEPDKTASLLLLLFYKRHHQGNDVQGQETDLDEE